MIYAIDVETSGLDARKFLLACVIDQNLKERYFYSPQEVRDWLWKLSEHNKKRKKNAFIYGHNHQYDLYSYFHKYLTIPQLKIMRWNPLMGTFNENIYLLDTMAFFPMPLSKVGDIVNLPKLETPEELIDGREIQIESIKPYLFRDTLITIKSILMLKEKLALLGFKPRKYFSAGQIAISCFFSFLRKEKKSFYLLEDGKIHEPKNPDLVRKAFRGGRVQAFKLGTFSNTFAYDQNAQHPYVESKMRFPYLNTESFINKPDVLPTNIGVSMVTIIAPSKFELQLPYLPITWGEYEQIYPNNCEMTGVWTNLELNHALKLGYKITHLYWSIVYKEMPVNPFKEYQEVLFNLKRDSNKTMQKVVKLLMNSFGMKFSQRSKNKEYKFIERQFSLTVEPSYKFEGYVDNKYIYSKESEYIYPYYYNPIISVLITANARHEQYICMKKVPYDKLLYCDTDSIIVEDDSSKYLDIGTNMGQWKEFASNVNSVILSEKIYSIGSTTKMSGVPSKYRENISLVEDNQINFPKLFTFNNAIGQGQFNKVGSSYNSIFKLKKSNKTNINYPNVITEEK